MKCIQFILGHFQITKKEREKVCLFLIILIDNRGYKLSSAIFLGKIDFYVELDFKHLLSK